MDDRIKYRLFDILGAIDEIESLEKQVLTRPFIE